MGELLEKVCTNCGEKLPGDSAFCIKCGAKIDESEKMKVKYNFLKNKDKIKQYGKWKAIAVKFNDDKSVMLVSPAITSNDYTEIWVNTD